jgi:hypothetical protein
MKRKIVISLIFSALLIPGVTYGAAIGVSFGSKAFAKFPCTCTKGKVWYFTSPTFGTVAYTVGTQAKSKYNLPSGTQILGLYNPAVNGLCWMGVTPYCTLFPTNGTVMPMVGSSI